MQGVCRRKIKTVLKGFRELRNWEKDMELETKGVDPAKYQLFSRQSRFLNLRTDTLGQTFMASYGHTTVSATQNRTKEFTFYAPTVEFPTAYKWGEEKE